jgi:hypothetical protein
MKDGLRCHSFLFGDGFSSEELVDLEDLRVYSGFFEWFSLIFEGKSGLI